MMGFMSRFPGRLETVARYMRSHPDIIYTYRYVGEIILDSCERKAEKLGKFFMDKLVILGNLIPHKGGYKWQEEEK